MGDMDEVGEEIEDTIVVDESSERMIRASTEEPPSDLVHAPGPSVKGSPLVVVSIDLIEAIVAKHPGPTPVTFFTMMAMVPAAAVPAPRPKGIPVRHGAEGTAPNRHPMQWWERA